MLGKGNDEAIFRKNVWNGLQGEALGGDGRTVFFPGCSREYKGINLLQDKGSPVYCTQWLEETRVV